VEAGSETPNVFRFLRGGFVYFNAKYLQSIAIGWDCFGECSGYEIMNLAWGVSQAAFKVV
jgi:hypothetical protein